MTTCIIAEKPSVARNIARIVGAKSKQEGYMVGRKTVGFGHGKGDEVSHCPSNDIAAAFHISVLLARCSYDVGNISGYRGFLGDNTSCHSR